MVLEFGIWIVEIIIEAIASIIVQALLVAVIEITVVLTGNRE
jgi:hypothetical protein